MTLDASASVQTIPWEDAVKFIRMIPKVEGTTRRLIDKIDYSETWTANSPTRAGSYLLLRDPLALQVRIVMGTHSDPGFSVCRLR